jgi:hypothetical protein
MTPDPVNLLTAGNARDEFCRHRATIFASPVSPPFRGRDSCGMIGF